MHYVPVIEFMHYVSRHTYSSRTFIVPVVLYAVLYNIPKFFELTTACKEMIPVHVNGTHNTSAFLQDLNEDQNISQVECNYSNMVIVATQMRCACVCVLRQLVLFFKEQLLVHEYLLHLDEHNPQYLDTYHFTHCA